MTPLVTSPSTPWAAGLSRDDIEPAEGSTPFSEINVAPFDANEIYVNYNAVRDFWQMMG